jgi:hypothetical protein
MLEIKPNYINVKEMLVRQTEDRWVFWTCSCSSKLNLILKAMRRLLLD